MYIQRTHRQPILIQGAMDIELQQFIARLNDQHHLQIAGYDFYQGTFNGIPLVISNTLVGVVNSTTATSIGIMEFQPSLVINQGLAGAHQINLHIGDIVIGKQCCNINAYKMPTKGQGQGSNPFEWDPNKRARDIKSADQSLANLIKKYFTTNIPDRKIYCGILGSGDVHNREYDRIIWLHQTFNHLCEDMESIGAYSVCQKFHVPCVGIRIISNNDLLAETLAKNQAITLQNILLKMIQITFK